ncbi:unnamed protein product, partial [Ectocarpus sp. 12 AP-2014]
AVVGEQTDREILLDMSPNNMSGHIDSSQGGGGARRQDDFPHGVSGNYGSAGEFQEAAPSYESRGSRQGSRDRQQRRVPSDR